MKLLPLNQLEDLIRAEVLKGDLSLSLSLSLHVLALLAFSYCGFYYSTLISMGYFIIYLFILSAISRLQ
jgi:hypothetical protein